MIEVTDDLSKAMDDLLGLRPDDVAHDEVVRRKLLSTSEPKREKEETFQLRFEHENAGNAAPAADGEESKRRQVTVAVVDDDPIIQSLVQTVFRATGWEIIQYNNGKEFVGNLASRAFDLVFLDLMMPVMDGFQVLAYLNKKQIDLPIIVLSALSQQETVVTAMKLGVNCFLTKPFKPDNLFRKSAEILNAYF